MNFGSPRILKPVIRQLLGVHLPGDGCGCLIPIGALRKEKPPGLYDDICEEYCPRSFQSCELDPNQCPRALNGSVDNHCS